MLSTFTYTSPKIFAWIGKCRMHFTREHQSCSQLWLEEQVPFSYRHHSLGLEGGTRIALSSGILDPQLFCCQLSSSPALAKARLFLCNKRKVPAQDIQARYVAQPGCVPAAAHQAATTAVPGEALV